MQMQSGSLCRELQELQPSVPKALRDPEGGWEDKADQRAKAVKAILTEIGLQSKGGEARSSVPTAPLGASAWRVCGVAPVAGSVLDCREQPSNDRRLGPQGSCV